MYKRPDSDIFGTKQVQKYPRINNQEALDPNQAFKKRNDQNYDNYFSKIGKVGRKNIQGNPQMTKVNQKVTFDEEYHKSRKYKDMQSSIFYEPKQFSRPQTSQQTRPLRQKLHDNNQAHETKYGRKNTIKRQIDNLPYNQSNIKGNASQLFDFDTKDQNHTGKKDQIVLIPHQMQWDQHDSIRYQHNKPNGNKNPLVYQSNTIENTEETKSNEDQGDKNDRKIQMKVKEQKNCKQKQETKNLPKKAGNSKKEEQKKQTKGTKMKQSKNEEKVIEKSSDDVEIKVLKGWDNKYMQGLTKYCKLYATPIMKFQFESEGKAVIFLKRTKKWQVITDWLTKQAKLKIKVIHK